MSNRVFNQSSTEDKKRQINSTLSTINNQSLYLSFVSEGKKQSSDIPYRQNLLKPVKKHQTRFCVYLPETYVPLAIPELKQYESSAKWMIHRLYEMRVMYQYESRDSYVQYNSVVGAQYDPNFNKVKNLLLEHGIIERTSNYIVGERAYGYRLADEAMRNTRYHRVPLGDSRLAARIKKVRCNATTTRMGRWLYSHLFKIGLSNIDEQFLYHVAKLSVADSGGTIENKLDAYFYTLDRIVNNDHMLSQDHQGRRYTLISGMKRELRPLLHVDGQKLMQIDISNSQWLFLAHAMRQDGVHDERFFRSCESGELYEEVAEVAGCPRSKVKKVLTQQALFSKNAAHVQKHKIKQAFDGLYPTVASYIAAQKPVDGSDLAKRLQSLDLNPALLELRK